MVAALILLAAVAAGSLPYWLPVAIVRLRVMVFARINGDAVVELPAGELGAAAFRRVYGSPSASGRSRGAALSDLFWYWLSPGAHLHQEHLEPGETYDQLARVTRRLVGLSTGPIERLVERCVGEGLERLSAAAHHRVRRVRIEDWMVGVWADFYYQVVFGERCPAKSRELLAAHARNVSTALKCTSLRDMRTRTAVTALIAEKLATGRYQHGFPQGMPIEDRALFLQGVFFTTGVVQTSGAMAHLLLSLARCPAAQDRLAASDCDPRYLEAVVDESLRRFPLFGIAHRIANDDVELCPGRVAPRGTVLCFNYQKFHREGFDEPDAFRPERWADLNKQTANYIPFGMQSNRPCPAQRIAWVSTMTAARVILAEYEIRSWVAHSRSLPNRGPCLLLARNRTDTTLSRAAITARLAAMRMADDWANVYRSGVQLALGTYMVLDARRLQLCARHFERAAPAAPDICPAAEPPKGVEA